MTKRLPLGDFQLRSPALPPVFFMTAQRTAPGCCPASSMPLQSHSLATRLTLDALKRLVEGNHHPERSLPDVVKPSRCCWPKSDPILERESAREAQRVLVLCSEY